MINSLTENKIYKQKNTQVAIIAVITLSILLLVGPTSMTLNAFAQGNTANQAIGQAQSSTQLGVCVSGTGTLISCNNLNAQNQANSGNNALAQQGVQIFSKNGTFISKFGGEGTGPGQFIKPESITIDSTGRVYVADTTNNNVQLFVPNE